MHDVTASLFSKDSLVERIRRTALVARPSSPFGVSQAFWVELDRYGKKEMVSSDEILRAAKSLRAQGGVVERFLRNRTVHAEMETERFPSSVRAWLNYARTCINAGDIVAAQDALEKASALAPENSDVKATFGRLLAFQGRLDEALNVYEQLLSSRDDAAARENVASLLLAQGRAEEAIEYLQPALKQSPSRTSLHINLGIAYIETQKADRAVAHFRKAAELEPSPEVFNGLGVSYALCGNKKKAERAFRTVLQMEPAQPGATLNLARMLGEQDRWQEAIPLLSGLLMRYSGHWEARETLGAALFHSGRYKEAAQELGRILAAIDGREFDGDRSVALNNLGVTMLRLGELERAEALFRESMRTSDGKNHTAVENLSGLYMITRRSERARELLERLQELRPKARTTRLLVAYYHYLNQRYEDALAQTRSVLQESPNDADAACLASCILMDAYESYREAEELLRPIWHKYPLKTGVINNLAYALILQGKLREARDLLGRIQWGPDIDSNIALATRGLLLIAEGDVEGGAQLYNTAARQAGAINRDLQALIQQKKELEVGGYYLKLGRMAQARGHLERAAAADVSNHIYTRKAQKLLEKMAA